MSRIILHNGNRFTVVVGVDHVLKSFAQIYDKTQVNKTPEGEGLVFDWSVEFGLENNRTKIDINKPKSILKLIEDHIRSEEPKEYVDLDIPSLG